MSQRCAPDKPQKWYSAGFTLVEMMIVMVVIGVLLGLAAPAYSKWIKDLRLDKALNVTYSSMIRARSEAQRNRSRVSLCRTGNIYGSPPTCGAAIHGTSTASQQKDWSHGWLIYTTSVPSTDYTPGAGDQLIAAIETNLSGRNVKVTSNTASQSHITYAASGRISSGSPVFAICDNRNDSEAGYRITFSASGRPGTDAFRDIPSAERDCTP